VRAVRSGVLRWSGGAISDELQHFGSFAAFVNQGLEHLNKLLRFFYGACTQHGGKVGGKATDPREQLILKLLRLSFYKLCGTYDEGDTDAAMDAALADAMAHLRAEEEEEAEAEDEGTILSKRDEREDDDEDIE